MEPLDVVVAMESMVIPDTDSAQLFPDHICGGTSGESTKSSALLDWSSW